MNERDARDAILSVIPFASHDDLEAFLKAPPQEQQDIVESFRAAATPEAQPWRVVVDILLSVADLAPYGHAIREVVDRVYGIAASS
jgi:hypothetical protein